ncbi:hypothetical protein SCLCIDRAFT_1216423 [Scleroderma citrinum Foug A]|uniref:Uncharacterized protein n=1 Tax=Scleroderma citrinum Foug A TaxID=1036808 RepID=A0A0C3DYE4_9AGAM|nr:hypothetical protein SCLCIDRAFT_1216423 [Scleroderma citrinum Foug A]
MDVRQASVTERGHGRRIGDGGPIREFSMEREGVVHSRCTDCTTFSHLALIYQTEEFLPFGDDNAMGEPSSGT